MEFTGIIEGGWGYIWAAYGVSLSILLAYALVVTFRLRSLRGEGDES